MFSALKVPQLSAPLTKAIRTSEGIMAWVITIGIAVFSYVEGLEFIPHEVAAWIIGINGVFHGASRTLLKIFAIQKEVGIEPPEVPTTAQLEEAANAAPKATTTPTNITLGQP